ncbi:Zn(II)2Cys6 transcription factor [Aspergillus novofumigatus IBT 16806]|uniref:Zn(2)-C6 fungal-type domain-containing protein n=1 Tax=Aspergillus novofumigatus (strain IBT 16806) TaxID=1392255 RepID=A0A2I1C7C9_ASPN1|nr:uncharacterized protein P174DRAFT_450533 [Aspergillus novofumigatus IBT 16806]PKX93523.1 hypothetical protein P174DRAFT_450533 [Aspergillus novofumigatus IBT 16806]
MPVDQNRAPRNCVSCKERKARCDRRRPCVNCTKANQEFIFPTTGRILRQPQRMRRETPASSGRQVDLMDCIHRLENVVSRLHARTDTSQSKQHENLAGSEEGLRRANDSSEIGVLVRQERGRLYVGDGFWADLQQENINAASHEDDAADSIYTPSLQSSHRTISASATSFLFSSRSMSTASTEDLRPLPSQTLFTWQTFVENVDPFIRVLHVPTICKMIPDSRGNFDVLPSSMEPLMFSIAFAAVKSLSSEEVQIHFRSNKKDLVSRFRLGTENCLSRADFINTKELSVVQALLVYTLLIRLEESQRPFETEVRRRAWCYIRILDFATGDFQVPETSISDAISDTNLPLNLDDDDVQLNMSALPEARNGHTDMAICLLRSELDADTLHQLEQLSKFSQQEFAEFLAPSQPDKPIYLFTRTMAAVAVRRYELIVHHIRQPSLQHSNGRLETGTLFHLAVGILEYIHMLQHGPLTRCWAWQLDGFIQWQPLALVLSRLSVVEFNAMAERAWSVVTRILEACPESIREEPLWQPLLNVIQSVKKRRLQQLKNRSDNSVRRHYTPSDSTGALRNMKAEPSEGGGSALSWIRADDLPGAAQIATGTSPPTRHPSLEWRPQAWFLARINDPDAHVGGMDAISSVYQREEEHLPVEPEQSAPRSLPKSQDQNTGDESLQDINNPGWDEWNGMINMSEQSMLWDRWAF